MRYKVRLFQDSIYEVIRIDYNDSRGGIGPLSTSYSEFPTETSMFQGSLADCEAWIRLHENGYMD